jgi:tellurium resistance protein TerD
MAINLNKLQGINLGKVEPGLKNVIVGLGWDCGDIQADLDVSVFMLGTNNKIPAEEYFVFYNNKVSPDGSVIHSGDNRTGEGEGDDESIRIDLSRINTSVIQLMFVVSIHEAENRGQSFGMIQNAYIRIYNELTSKVIASYILTEKVPGADVMIMGRLFRTDNLWEFQAMGDGYNGGLELLVGTYA